jgi:hypothetical protein
MLVNDITQMYGKENVEFVKIDGNNVYSPTQKYAVQSFPTFVYVQPNTRGMKAILFRGDRSYESMKAWMVKILKDLPVLNGEEELAEEEEEFMDPYTPLITPPQPPKVDHRGVDP